MHTEIEAKLLVPDAAKAQAIARLRRIGDWALRPSGQVTLHTTYLDTDGLALARSGVALRLRRYRNKWEATAKWSGSAAGDVYDRPELTVPLPGPPQMPFRVPDGALRTRLAAILCDRLLAPVLVTEVRRRRLDVVTLDAAAEAEPLAELALDSVRARAPGDSAWAAQYEELEVELHGGDRSVVETVARLLRESFGLRPSPESKFARGMQLVYGKPIPAVDDEATPQPADCVADSARKIVARQLLRLRESDPLVRASDDPDAVHDMRVAIRRLRGTAASFAAAFPLRVLNPLTRDLKWLGELLGHVRDLDVQLAGLDRFIAAAPPTARRDLDSFRRFLQDEHRQRRAKMLAGMDSTRHDRLLLRLERYAQTARSGSALRMAAARTPIPVAAHDVLRKEFRRLRKCGDRTLAEQTPENLHALRIQAKRLRLLLDSLAAVTGKPGRRFASRLSRLQDDLGEYRDAIMSAEAVRDYSQRLGPHHELAQVLALGALMGTSLQQARDRQASAMARWEWLGGRRGRRQFKGVLRHLQAAN
jgi:triphosphatase